MNASWAAWPAAGAIAAATGWVWGGARPASRLRANRVGTSASLRLLAAGGRARLVAADRPGLAAGLGAVFGVVAAVGLRSPAPAVLGPLAAWAVWRVRRDRARVAAALARRRAVGELCETLAGELRAGRPAALALATAAAECGDPVIAARLGAAASSGDRTPAVLTELAAAPGARTLRQIAACWRVSEGSGAGLADALGRLAVALRAQQAHHAEITAELAGPRATARLLSVLPAFGLLLGAAMGAHPVRVLLRTSYGLGCLAVGVALALAGLRWMGSITRHAEEGS